VLDRTESTPDSRLPVLQVSGNWTEISGMTHGEGKKEGARRVRT